jgi:O-antigen/teichoic acid export membrane protein
MKKKDKKRNLYAMLSLTLKFGNGAFILPLMLFFLDEQSLSIWLVSSIITGATLIVDSGFGPSLVRATSYCVASIEKEGTVARVFNSGVKSLNNTISTFQYIYLLLSIIGGLLAYGAGQILVYSNENFMDYNNLKLIVLIISIRFSIAIINVQFISILQGLGLIGQQKQKESLIELIRITSVVLIIVFTKSLLYLFIVEALITLVSSFLYTNTLGKELKKFNIRLFSFSIFSNGVFKEMWKPTWQFGLMQYGGYASSQANSVIISQVGEINLINAYIITIKLINILKQFSQIPFNVEIPDYYRLFSTRRIDVLKSKVVNKIIYSFIIFSVLSFIFIFFGENLISLIKEGEGFLLNKYLLFILVISALFEMHHSFHANLYIASNKVPFLIPSIYTGCMLFIVGDLVILEYGVLGVIISQVAIQSSVNNWYPVYKSLNLLDWKFYKYLTDLKNEGKATFNSISLFRPI